MLFRDIISYPYRRFVAYGKWLFLQVVRRHWDTDEPTFGSQIYVTFGAF